MLIGVDLDEVLAGLIPQIIKYHNLNYKTSYVYDDFKSFFLWKTWGGTKEETDKKIWDFYSSKYFDDTIPIKGAAKGIDVLGKNHKLIVITSRPEDIKEKTEKWLEKFFPDKFSSIYFAYNISHGKGKVKKKLEICKDLGVKIIIEDVLENILGIDNVSNRMHAILLNKPWNNSKLPKKVTRVDSWEKIVNQINKLNENQR